MKNAIGCGLQGRYKLTVRRADGSVRMETDWFDNLILNAGLNRIGTGSVGTYCQVGAGNTAPAVTDTALQSYIAGTNSRQSDIKGAETTTAPYYAWHRRVYRFGMGVAAGNVSEVGIGWTGTTGNLFSRALVRDGGGSPLTITVLSDEYLDVTYELRVYWPEADTPFTATIGGVEYTGVVRPANVYAGYESYVNMLLDYGSNSATPSGNVYQGPLGGISTVPSGTSANATTVTLATYSNNSLKRDFTFNFGLPQGNVSGGIGALTLNHYWVGWFQISFSPKIPKTSSKVLTITGSYSWSRRTL